MTHGPHNSSNAACAFAALTAGGHTRSSARRDGRGSEGHGTPHTRTRTRTHRQVHARTHGHTTHARTLDCTHRTHAAVCACGSGDHDGGCGRRLGARVAAAASVAAVMGGRRRGRHGRVWHGWMRCGTGGCGGDGGGRWRWGSLVRGSRFGVRGLGFERYIY